MIPIIIIIAVSVICFGWKKNYSNGLACIAFFLVFMPDNVMLFPGFIFNLKIHRVILITFFVLCIFNRNTIKYENMETSNCNMSIPLKYIMIFSLISMLISTVLSINIFASVKNFISNTIEFYLFYILLYNKINKQEDVNKILYGVFLALFFSSLLGIVHSYADWNLMDYLPKMETRAGVGYTYDRGLRVWANFPHPILLGAAVSIGIIIGISLLFDSDRMNSKLFIFIGINAMFLCLYKTLSRGPMVGLAFGMAILFVTSNTKIRKILLLFSILAVFALLMRPGAYNTLTRVWHESFGTETTIGTSTHYRLALLNLAKETLMSDYRRLLFGFGPKTFWDIGLTGEFLDGEYNFVSCDSSWIEFLFTGGILYFSIMFFMSLKILKTGISSLIKYKNYLNDNICFLCIFSALIMFFLLMSVVAIYGWSQFGYLFWILAALFFGSIRIMCNNEDPIPKQSIS